ncbi:MAG: DUF4189 domain-containing protein [Hyphomicrobiales bacterium]|nr:DUF4189 domain-containing protein [Hyphomicrobiales bacterium]
MHNIDSKHGYATKIGAMIAVIFMMTSMASAQNKFGSIYYSPSTGANGYSYNYGNRYGAEQAALNECLGAGGTDCSMATWFRNACGALAVGDRNWGSHWGNNRRGAEYNALQKCNRVANNCRIVTWACTDH